MSNLLSIHNSKNQVGIGTNIINVSSDLTIKENVRRYIVCNTNNNSLAVHRTIELEDETTLSTLKTHSISSPKLLYVASNNIISSLSFSVNAYLKVSNTGGLGLVDKTAPIVQSISATDGTYGFTSPNNIINITVNFNESVTVTGTPSLTLSNSTTASYISGDNSSSILFRYTIQQSDTNSSSLSVSSLSGTIEDLSGNPCTSINGTLGSVVVDTTITTVSNVTSSTTNGSYKAGDAISIQVVFSKTVIVTGTPQLTLETGTNDADVNYASGSGSNTLTFTYTIASGATSSDLDYEATNSLSLNGGTIKDIAGNSASLTLPSPGATGSLGANKAFVIDTTAPSVVSFTISDTSLKVGETATVTLQFSESVSGFNSDDDISVQNGSLATMTSSDNITWTGTFTPTDDIEDTTNILQLATSSYTDSVGNSGPAAQTANYSIDTKEPTVVSFTISDTSLKVGETATVTLQFSESVSGFNSDADITEQNGSLATMTSSDNITWTGTFTPTDDIEDTSNILQLATSYTDSAGNSGPAAQTANYSIDTKEPTVVSFTISDTSLKVGETATVTLQFSESVSGFNSDADITEQNGSLTTMTSSDNITWTGTFTPTDDIEDTTNILQLANSYTDSAGNSGPTAQTANYSIDTKEPILSNGSSIGTTFNTTPTFTFTSTEAGIITSSLSFSTSNSAIAGNNSITFTSLSANTYSSQWVKVTDSAGNVSNTLTIPTFTISLATWKKLEPMQWESGSPIKTTFWTASSPFTSNVIPDQTMSYTGDSYYNWKTGSSTTSGDYNDWTSTNEYILIDFDIYLRSNNYYNQSEGIIAFGNTYSPWCPHVEIYFYYGHLYISNNCNQYTSDMITDFASSYPSPSPGTTVAGPGGLKISSGHFSLNTDYNIKILLQLGTKSGYDLAVGSWTDSYNIYDSSPHEIYCYINDTLQGKTNNYRLQGWYGHYDHYKLFPNNAPHYLKAGFRWYSGANGLRSGNLRINAMYKTEFKSGKNFANQYENSSFILET